MSYTRLLVTGAGGYLGTLLVPRLLDVLPRASVVVLDRFDYGPDWLLAEVFPALQRRRVELHVGDVADPAAVRTALVGVDAIIHLAGRVGYPACDADPLAAIRDNLYATELLVELAAGRPLLFASTETVYGRVDGLISPLTESMPICPQTRYSKQKAQMEQRVTDAGGAALRLPGLFGWSSRMRWDLLFHTMAMALATQAVQPPEQRTPFRLYQGNARRNFLHVKDAVEAFVYMLQMYTRAPQTAPGVWNVGSPAGRLTKRQALQALQLSSDVRESALIVEDNTESDPERRDTEVDYTKLRSTGWTAQRGMELPVLQEVWTAALVRAQLTVGRTGGAWGGGVGR